MKGTFQLLICADTIVNMDQVRYNLSGSKTENWNRFWA